MNGQGLLDSWDKEASGFLFYWKEKKMEIDLETLKAGFEQVMFWFGTIVAAASIIVKATKTQKDDAVLAKVVKVLDWLSVFNTKENQKKIDGTAKKEGSE